MTAPNHHLNECWLISYVKSSGSPPKAIAQEIPQPSITKISLNLLIEVAGSEKSPFISTQLIGGLL